MFSLPFCDWCPLTGVTSNSLTFGSEDDAWAPSEQNSCVRACEGIPAYTRSVDQSDEGRGRIPAVWTNRTRV
eukprot:5738726-Pyramimonas_sp.AAC.1